LLQAPSPGEPIREDGSGVGWGEG